MLLFGRKLSDPFGADLARLRRGRYGVIEVVDGQLQAIYLRPWPTLTSALEVEWLGRRYHRNVAGDRCWLYFNQPRRHANYLALKYVVSQRDCRFATLRRAVEMLDEVARVKLSDAILCDVWNLRISARLLARCGYVPHKPERWHRNYIKRFYGEYPPRREAILRTCSTDAGTLAPAVEQGGGQLVHCDDER
jgi:hypothetical protein